MQLQLTLPDIQYEQSYRAYIQELGGEKRYPFPLSFDHSNFPKLIDRLKEFQHGINLPEGFVPSTTFWLIQGDELLGVSNLRHYLNDRIKYIGGHIGLGIRPAKRGIGLGKKLLGLTIKEAQRLGIDTVHIHCHKHNEPSARMIMANDGLLGSEVEESSGEIVQRYLVNASWNQGGESRGQSA